MLAPEVKLWWKQAKRDFKIAEHNHERRDYEAAVFFCEQAAQKALKALIIHRSSKPAPSDDQVPYPDAAGVPTTEIYDGRTSLRFVRGTRKVLEWCRNRLR